MFYPDTLAQTRAEITAALHDHDSRWAFRLITQAITLTHKDPTYAHHLLTDTGHPVTGPDPHDAAGHDLLLRLCVARECRRHGVPCPGLVAPDERMRPWWTDTVGTSRGWLLGNIGQTPPELLARGIIVDGRSLEP